LSQGQTGDQNRSLGQHAVLSQIAERGGRSALCFSQVIRALSRIAAGPKATKVARYNASVMVVAVLRKMMAPNQEGRAKRRTTHGRGHHEQGTREVLVCIGNYCLDRYGGHVLGRSTAARSRPPYRTHPALRHCSRIKQLPNPTLIYRGEFVRPGSSGCVTQPVSKSMAIHPRRWDSTVCCG
jgi:hypothetical protein